MSKVPSWKSFRIRKIHSSNPDVPEEDVRDNEEIVHVSICKVCSRAFSDTEIPVICARCGHYAHAECSNRFQMTVWDNLCIIETIGVDKRAFKVLYGLIKGYRKSRIRKAAAFSKSEIEDIVTSLVRSNFLSRKKFLFFNIDEITYQAHEVFPVLENIYCNEEDVQAYIQELETQSFGFSFGFDIMLELTLGLVLFGMLSIGFLMIMLSFTCRILFYMWCYGIGTGAQFLFAGFMIFVSCLVLLKLKRRLEQ